MPVTQQQRIFDANEAERFAALWAGFEIGNPSEAEAMSKGRAVRRMVAGKTLDDGTALRLVDAFELPEIRQALDDQIELPARAPVEDVAALKTENEDLRSKLAAVVPEVTVLAEALARETELRIRLQGRQNGSFAGPLLSGALALSLAVECVLAVIGLIGGRVTPRAAAPDPAPASPVQASVAMELAKPSAPTVTTPSRSYIVTSSGRVFMRAPRTEQPKPVSVPESSF
jgi:hypothetical protein